MPEELRIHHPETEESVVTVRFPEGMFSVTKAHLIDEAQMLGRTIISGDRQRPYLGNLKNEFVKIEGDIATPTERPHVPIERYDDEPGRGY
jgi:hypothetical protein